MGETMKVLLDHRAEINALEPKMKLPPLNTAIAAGNAKICLELLQRNADANWHHDDGATALHVAVAWIASNHNANLRIPPLGKEPVDVVRAMLHNGVNPLQTEGKTKNQNRAKGMTPLESFRREVANSPWRGDPQFSQEFDKTANEINKLLEQSESAIKLKDEGNKAFKEHKYEDAVKAWADARSKFANVGVQGHHMAVLWSNEALCRRRMRDLESSKVACNEGLKLHTSDEIRKKLQLNLEECAKPLPEPTEEEKQKAAEELEARKKKVQEKKDEEKEIAKKVVESSGGVYEGQKSGQKDYVVPPTLICPMDEAQRIGLGPPPPPKPYWEVDSDDEPPRTTIGFLPAHPPFPEPPHH